MERTLVDLNMQIRHVTFDRPIILPFAEAASSQIHQSDLNIYVALHVDHLDTFARKIPMESFPNPIHRQSAV
jgi:hypothetical protein